MISLWALVRWTTQVLVHISLYCRPWHFGAVILQSEYTLFEAIKSWLCFLNSEFHVQKLQVEYVRPFDSADVRVGEGY